MNLLVNIDVDDLARAIDFYCTALDLSVGRRFGDFGVELIGASSAIYLLKKPADTAISPSSSRRRDYARHWTPVHLDFVVPEIDAAAARAQAAGAQLEGEVQTRTWGRMAAFADPFGHGFCLIEFSASGYDTIAS